MTFDEAKDLLLKAMGTGIISYACYLMRDLVESVRSLNIKMAVIVENVKMNSERIKKIEDIL